MTVDTFMSFNNQHWLEIKPCIKKPSPKRHFIKNDIKNRKKTYYIYIYLNCTIHVHIGEITEHTAPNLK